MDEGEEVERKTVVCVVSMNFTFFLALMVRRARSRSTWLDILIPTGLVGDRRQVLVGIRPMLMGSNGNSLLTSNLVKGM